MVSLLMRADPFRDLDRFTQQLFGGANGSPGTLARPSVMPMDAWREGDTFLVEDLGSVNGTVVNEAVRLGHRQPRPLANGDRLRLGETTLHFLLG